VDKALVSPPSVKPTPRQPFGVPRAAQNLVLSDPDLHPRLTRLAARRHGRQGTGRGRQLHRDRAPIEDHATGNYWADEFDNPEHGIERIGVLVTTRPA